MNDNTFEINIINSNQTEPKKFTSCKIPFEDFLVKPYKYLPGLDTVSEQRKDSALLDFVLLRFYGPIYPLGVMSGMVSLPNHTLLLGTPSPLCG